MSAGSGVKLPSSSCLSWIQRLISCSSSGSILKNDWVFVNASTTEIVAVWEDSMWCSLKELSAFLKDKTVWIWKKKYSHETRSYPAGADFLTCPGRLASAYCLIDSFAFVPKYSNNRSGVSDAMAPWRLVV